MKVAEIFSSGWALVDAEGGGCGKRPKVFFLQDGRLWMQRVEVAEKDPKFFFLQDSCLLVDSE